MLGFNSPRGLEISNCTEPALSSVNGESYAQENGVKIFSLNKGIIIQLNHDQLGSRYWP
jgi:hypothetical protein